MSYEQKYVSLLGNITYGGELLDLSFLTLMQWKSRAEMTEPLRGWRSLSPLMDIGKLECHPILIEI